MFTKAYIKEILSDLVESELFKVFVFVIFVVGLACGLGFGICKFCEASQAQRLAENERLEAIQHEHTLQQTAMVDSISVVFMKAWAKVKDTEDFKHCSYYKFSYTDLDGTVDFVKAYVSCDEIKDLPDVGKFKPTAMAPGINGEAMSVIFKFFPNKK